MSELVFFLEAVTIVLATCSVTTLLIALSLWRTRWIGGVNERDRGMWSSLYKRCCPPKRAAVDTPVYANENSQLEKNLLGHSITNQGRRGNPSQTNKPINTVSTESYHPSIPYDSASDLYTEVTNCNSNSGHLLHPTINPQKMEVNERSHSDTYSYVQVPDNRQIYANVSVEVNNSIGSGLLMSPNAGRYESVDSTHAMATVEEEVVTKQAKNDPQSHLYSHPGIRRNEHIGCDSNADYTEPARDENSLYAQFKILNVKLVKRRAIKLGEYLGSGQFGTVYSGEWNSDLGHHCVKVAVKTLNANSLNEDKVRFLQEAAIMGQFNHNNVIKMYGLVIEQEPFMIILELLSKGDLRHYLQSMRHLGGVDSDLPLVLLQCCRQIAFGMCYLSRKGFIHRDLAARNVLVAEDGTCKVADFGMSRDLAHEDYYISHGGQVPVKWTAPEAMHFRKYSTASDVWSFGVVMYEIWSLGHKPFEGYTNQEALKLIDKGVRLTPPPGCPRAIYSFMIKCWNPISSARPTFQGAVTYLQMSQDQLLKWSVKEKAVQLSACHLGADLDVAERLHEDLRETYKKK